MKFGKFLQETLYSEWRFHYLDYEGLKQLLKERTSEGSFFAEKDEANFAGALEKEIQKVFDFRDVKVGELTRHVQYCENLANDAEDGKPVDVNKLNAEIERITFEVSQLEAFSRLNSEGFSKILKKHDKRTEFMLKPMFLMRLKSKSLDSESLDFLIFRLSKLYDRIRSWSSSESEKGILQEAATSNTQTFVRKTTKYWVHSDNVTEVKCVVLKYLPVLIFPSRKRTYDLAVSSVYFDDDHLSLYRGRLEKSEGALAIRIRWYGSEEPRDVFIERKVHREDWTGELSVKSRFQIKEKYVNDFLVGGYTSEDIRQKMLKEGKSTPEEIESAVKLADEVQQVIIARKLKPKLRTFYNRVAFQLPGDARVRISLDTDLTMIREDGPKRSGDNWRREDIDTNDFPFLSLPADDIVRFPHAILEVKLQTQVGQEPPKWVEKLVGGHLVEEVPKFSKFIHGCATLFPDKIDLLPFWLPQMNVDIRKEPISDTPVINEDDEDDSDDEPSYDRPVGSKEKSAPHIEIDLSDIVVGSTNPSRDDVTNEKRPTSMKTTSSVAANAASSAADKRVHIPVRVEPKVYFANERTFLSWIHFSFFLGGIGTTLIGLGHQAAQLSGYVLGAVSLFFSGYALYLYRWRAAKIKNREPGPYDDHFGPLMVVFVFVGAMILTMVLNAIKAFL